MAGKILVVGSINMDLVVRSPRLPEKGETILGGDFGTYPGGKGANQAVAAARLGAAVAMIGRVGTDSFGDSLLSSLRKDRVDTSGVQRDPGASSGVALITVDHQGQNTIVVASGTNLRLSPEDVSARENLFADSSSVVMQLEIPLSVVRRAVELARKQGALVLLNPAPAQPLDDDLLSGVDYLLPNEGELASLSGQRDLSKGAQTLRSRGVKNLLVTLGEQGVLLVNDDGEHKIPAFKVKAVDTTGAGDTFVGAFAAALSEGKPALEAERWASAAAAISVTRPGAQPSMPTRDEVEKFLR